MHLGYHELRRMLQQFKEEREKRRNAPPPPAITGAQRDALGASGIPSGPGGRGGGPGRDDYKSSGRDDGDRYRDRDRG